MEVSGQLHAAAALIAEKNPVTLSVGGWLCPGTSPNLLEKRNSPGPVGIWTPNRPACKQKEQEASLVIGIHGLVITCSGNVLWWWSPDVDPFPFPFFTFYLFLIFIYLFIYLWLILLCCQSIRFWFCNKPCMYLCTYKVWYSLPLLTNKRTNEPTN
jgi:hypothetical protein